VITKPRKCNRGYYSGFGESICKVCDAGWFCDQPELLPTPCPIGTYSKAGSY